MLTSAAQVYTRHNQLQRQEVGDTFEMPPAGMFRLHLRAEIVSAAGFEHSCLYVNWVLDLPPGWAAAQDTPLQVKIFVATQKNICWSGCKPAVLDLGRGRRGALLSAGGGRPLLLHQPAGRGQGGGAAVAAAAAGGGELRRVRAADIPSAAVTRHCRWGRHRVEGYGHASLPSHPGHHTLTLDTWRPVGSSPAAEMKRWIDSSTFSGDGIQYFL